MYKIKIAFGQDSTFVTTREFETEAEMEAYLLGLSDMEGWHEYQVYEDQEGERRGK